MIQTLILLLLAGSLFAMEHKSEISTKYINYKNFQNEIILQGNTEVKFENELVLSNIKVEYLYSNEDRDRRYILLNEFYLTKEYLDYSLIIGKTIKYWGELEGFNVADVYNQKNYLLDPFKKSDKLGSMGISLWRYFNTSTIEVGMKLYEEDIIYPSTPAPYNPLPLEYDKKLRSSDGRYSPSLYLVYSFITDEVLDSENKFIIMHGYDNKRYFINISEDSLSQYAYRVNKFLFLSHIVSEEIIFKSELSYTDVVNDKKISDYAQLSFGIEKSFYNIADTTLGTYLEYYKYIYMQGSKIENVDISEIYNNDIFLALKMNFNDVKNSEVKVGILYDIKHKEKVFKVEAKSRIMDSLVFNIEYLQIVSSKTGTTLLSNLEDSTRAIVGLSYSF